MITINLKQIIEELGYNNCDIDLCYHLDEDEIIDMSENDIQEVIDGAINEIEVIYYSKAIKYLAENDASLRDSMALAAELCTPIKDISSELLATLLMQDITRESLCSAASEIYNAVQEVLDNEDKDE